MANLQSVIKGLTVMFGVCLLALLSVNSLAMDERKAPVAATELTAEDQSLKATDIEITKTIRQQILNNKTVSLGAQNIKVISQNGHVTLKGSVVSPQEKTLVGEIAQSVVGVGKVTNDTKVAKR